MWYISVLDQEGSKEEYKQLIEQWKQKIPTVLSEKINDEAKRKKLIDSYKENLQGISQDIDNPSKHTRFLKVLDEHKTPAILCKASITGQNKNVDLSEIVKHPNQSSEAMWALMAWAVDTANPDGEVTLTAAYGLLLKIYRRYGFEAVNSMHKNMYSNERLEASPEKKSARINAPMTMQKDSKEHISNMYEKGVFWNFLDAQAVAHSLSLFPDFRLTTAISSTPVLLNGMKVLFDEPAPVYPVNVVLKNQED